ncbi:MAG TPA: ATP-binding protein, partial [Thermomicrobiales bacterium]|nr:ATP-binding protein [Thermomicrobiales bacterium]
WGEFKMTFHARMFDDGGVLRQGPDGASDWFTRRPRFRSQIPLEYAYGAWRRLPDPKPREKDQFEEFADVEPADLVDFEERRLFALAWIARDLRPNPDTTKTSFSVPDLASFSDHRPGLARALYEFIMVERHVGLAEWRTERNAAPEQRALAGITLLGRYLEADQDPVTREANRRHAALQAVTDARLAELRQDNPEAKWGDLSKEEKAALNWQAEGMTVRLRLSAEGTGVDLDELLAATSLRGDDRALIAKRWMVDSRLPADQQVERAATPKQLLTRGMRGDLEAIEVERDAAGRVVAAWARFRFGPRRGDKMAPFAYPGHPEPLQDETLYTIEPDPNNWTGYWARNVINGLREGEPNALFARLAGDPDAVAAWRPVPNAPQARFLAGVEAMWEREGREPLPDRAREYILRFGHDPLLLVQGPPGAGKSYTTALALLAHLQASLAADMPCRVVVSANTHAAVDVVLAKLLEAQAELCAWRIRHPDLFADWFDPRLLDVPMYRFDPKATTPAGALPLYKKEGRPNGIVPLDLLRDARYGVIAAVTNGVYSIAKERVRQGSFFSHACVDCLVLDEASRMSLPDGIMAALPLTPEAPIVVVGDHRQMQPIRKHNWDDEPHRTFRDYAVYESLFDTLQARHVPTIRFDRSYRLHKEMAECLRDLIYRRDGIPFHSLRDWTLRDGDEIDDFVRHALDPAYPMVVVMHDEAGSLKQNEFEGVLIAPLLRALLERGYDVRDGLGVVVPHRAQRALLRERLRTAAGGDATADDAVDTVERFQGGERDAIIISATESDPAYLLQAGEFLFDPSRLTVALSRAREKMILVASRSVFDLFSPEEHLFQNALLWKNLLRRTCTINLWNGPIEGRRVEVWGNQPKLAP